MGASLLAAALADAAPQVVRYVPAHSIDIEYRAAGPAVVRSSTSHSTEAELWVSTDAGRSWQQTETERVGRTTLRYTAPADGRYDFYLVLRNEAGTSAAAPEPGATPTVSVVADTVPPLFQAHSAQPELADDGALTVLIHATIVEENLSADAIRVFYRASDAEWTDGGVAARADGGLSWTHPRAIGRTVDLRLVATDLAGNRTTSDLSQVSLPTSSRDAAEKATATQPAVGPWPASIEPVGPPMAAAVTPPAVEPVGPVAETQPASPEPTTQPAAPDPQNLRKLAARFMGEGRYALAVARLEEALEVAPGDADVLVELGSALYRLARYNDSDQRFQSALDLAPDHPGAIEGLALVAATQKRYPQAREHLRHLLRLRPESGSVWLRVGDIEHRLGNEAEALDAWERVLTARETDADVRRQAQRRLDYFGRARERAGP